MTGLIPGRSTLLPAHPCRKTESKKFYKPLQRVCGGRRVVTADGVLHLILMPPAGLGEEAQRGMDAGYLTCR